MSRYFFYMWAKCETIWLNFSVKTVFCLLKNKILKNKKMYSRQKNWHIYFAKTLDQTFPQTRRFHWSLENSDLKSLPRKYVSSLYRSIFHFFLVLIFLDKIFFVYFYKLLVGFNTFSINIVSWESRRRCLKKLGLVTKWKSWGFSTSYILSHFYQDKIGWDNS